MIDDFSKFVISKRKNATFSFWDSYLEMVDIVLLLTKATRESNWNLHLAAIREVLPWMFAYDRTNYARYFLVYWLEMSSLPSAHLEIYLELGRGNFTVQRQDNHGFSSLACDMAIEKTANRDSKSRGGMTGFTTNKFKQRAEITRDRAFMSGRGERSNIRKDLTESRLECDENAVQSIPSTISNLVNPFGDEPDEDATNLIHLSSGLIASPEVRSDLMTAYNTYLAQEYP
ncbi:hypothetical protein HOLleu_01021 [Holothuria leucospilota]|uniref:Uncharacterized protein n=1 Tax=Holothuria leucospilota TaxID=206669 RepID=A0A9Q1CMY3_HOLLE|nr:hypothetical protein HOLleu_01021 [Holothuria leucospilota]